MADTRLCEALGLKYQRARGSEFGKYVTAGGHVQPYYGLVRGPIDIHFSRSVTLTLRFLKIVEHGEPLLLLGADVLRGGRPKHQWNFKSVGAHTLDVGKCQGFLTFTKHDVDVEIPILNAPAGLTERKQGMNEMPAK